MSIAIKNQNLRIYQISFTGGHQRNYREIASTYVCSFVTSGTFRGSGNVTVKPNKGRYSRLFWSFVNEWANYVKIWQCYSMKIWFTLVNRPNVMLKKALLWDEDRNQIEHRMGFLQFYVKTKKVCWCFASFSSEKAHITHGMYITALILPSDVKKSNRSCSMKEWCQRFQEQ